MSSSNSERARARRCAEELRERAAQEGRLPPGFDGHDPIDWPANLDWSALDDRRGDLPEFPVEIFDPAWQHWLKRAAHGAGAKPDHVAVPLLSVASSLIGAARRVWASSSWSEPLSLWTAVVGFSGSGKTPGLEVSRRALASIERNRMSNIDEARRAHERLKAAAQAAAKQWK